jgi:hypothetical protein
LIAEKRTTFRLDAELHQKLKTFAARKEKTADELVNLAIESFLIQQGELRQRWKNADVWGPDLAELFLQFLPTPCVLKHADDFSIAWYNLSFSLLLQKPLSLARGKSLKDLNLGTDFLLEIATANMKKSVEAQAPTKDIEELVLPSGGVSFRAERFVFGGKKWLGDFSFVQREIREHDLTDWKPSEVLNRLRKSPPPEDLSDVLVELVHESPTAAVIKRAEDPQVIIYSNKEYNRLAKQDPIGKTVQQVFKGLGDNHLVVTNDHKVRDLKVATCEKAQLPSMYSDTPRWSYRFPIMNPDGNVRFVASISPDFLNR